MSAWDKLAGRAAKPSAASAWDNPAKSYQEAKETLANEDDRPFLVKVAAKALPQGKAKERFNQKPYAKQQKYNEETFNRTHLDVFRERFGENHPAYQKLMQMADSLDNEHNHTGGAAIMGVVPNWAGIRNKWHKDKLRETFDKLGIKRLNDPENEIWTNSKE